MAAVTTFESFDVETLERLVVPSEPDTHTFIPFGIDGTSVAINRYGEILNVLQYAADGSRKIIALDTYDPRHPYMTEHNEELNWRSQNQRTGLHVHLMPTLQDGEKRLEPSLEWVNGRWPRISYDLGGLRMFIQFTVEQGVISQQFLIVNPSNSQKDVQYALQADGSTVSTLHIEDNKWEMTSDFDWSAAKPRVERDGNGFFTLGENAPALSKGDTIAKSISRSEAGIALFHNGIHISSENIVLIPIKDEISARRESGMRSLPFDQMFPNVLSIPAHGVQELVVQYELRSHRHNQSSPFRYLDIGTFLHGDQHGHWRFQDDTKFNTILRRQLEHILCVCLVKTVPNSKSGPRVPFDTMLASGSTPASDFFVFRYLLYMYQVLGTNECVSFQPMSSCTPSTPSDSDRLALQGRIKEACQGHLRWCFDKDVFLAKKSLPVSENAESKIDSLEDDPGLKSFNGSFHLLKLFEFSRIFEEDKTLIEECLQACVSMWLDALVLGRDAKSGLWYRSRETYVPWEGYEYEESEKLSLPEYRLGDLIYVWKALLSVEQMSRKFVVNQGLLKRILQRLNDLTLQHQEVRKLILQRFVCQNLNVRRNDHLSPATILTPSDQISKKRPNSEAEQIAYEFVIALRRSRMRDRILFYAKDTLVYEGFEWGFFRNDLEIEAINTRNEIVKADVSHAWEQTVRAQSSHLEVIWKTPLRYALAIAMASCGQSLDNSRESAELAKISWEGLLKIVTPCGLLPSKINWESKLPDTTAFLDGSSSPYEILTILLRHLFKQSDLNVYQEKPTISSPKDHSGNSTIQQVTISQPGQYTTPKTKLAIKRRIKSEKRKPNSARLVDLNQVSDPIEKRMKDWLYPFPSFFSPQLPYKSMLNEILYLDQRLEADLKGDLAANIREDLVKILKRGAGAWTSTDGSSSKFMWSSVLVRIAGYIREKSDVYWCFPELLEEYLNEVRRVEDSNKLFHYFGPFQAADALVLYLTSPFEDRYRMAQFLTRHSSFAIHFQENVHPLADVWATELHLSFIQLVDREQENFNEAAGYVTVCDGYQCTFPHAVRGSQPDVFKASLSYRFLGDMTDQFWSGYLLTYLPQNSKLLKNPDWSVGANDLKSWFYSSTERDQRKILEPFVVEKMAGEIYQSTKVLLDSIDDWLNLATEYSKEKGTSTKSNRSKAQERNFEARYMRSTICIDIDSILTTTRRLYEANLYSLDQWAKREENRYYKPRWTEDDELLYRDLVDIQRKRAEQQISLLQDQHRRIHSSIDQVERHRRELIDVLSLAETRVAANNAENVRIFTYATVIFYPLSFLSSFFSMQGLPTHETIVFFVRATAIALAITLLIVFNANTIAYPIRRLRYNISQRAREKMEESSNVFPIAWRKTLDRINNDEKQDVLHDNEPPRPPRSKIIYLLFLVVFVLVEYPAQRIALAYESLRRLDVQDMHQLFKALSRLLIAIALIPVFVPVWLILAIWTLVPLAILDVYNFSSWIWTTFRTRIAKRYDQDRPAKQPERGFDEKREERESGPSRRPWSPRPHEEKSGRKENRVSTPPNRLSERDLQGREDREKRLRKQVSLLINPPEMMDRTVFRKLRQRQRQKAMDDSGTQV